MSNQKRVVTFFAALVVSASGAVLTAQAAPESSSATGSEVNAPPPPPATPALDPLDPAEGISADALALEMIGGTEAGEDYVLQQLRYKPGDYIRRVFTRVFNQRSGDQNHLNSLRGAMEKALLSFDPKHYPRKTFMPKTSQGKLERRDICYHEIRSGECNDRIAGFAAAAWYSGTPYDCWKGLDDFQRSTEFNKGYIDWWRQHVTDGAESCKRPSVPPRCLLASCGGPPDGYAYGVAFRPSLQLGTTLGEGLGFHENGGLAAQFSASLGVRAFAFHDKVDFHSGFGIGTSSADAEDSEGEGEGDSLASRGFLAFELGFGFFSGIANVSYVHIFDPFNSSRGSGNGLSLYVDAAALQRLSTAE